MSYTGQDVPWRQQLRPARFRGVAFECDLADNRSGRRIAVHEFPLRDQPEVEDLGLRVRRFSLDGYVIGPNYAPARDRLIEALSAEGPGELIHPWRGELTVQVEDFSWRESTREGGICQFRLDFVEASAARYPTATADTRSLLQSAAADCALAAQEEFAEAFSVMSQPEFVRSSALASLRGMAQRIRALAQSLNVLPEELSEGIQAVDDFSATISTLVNTPLALAGQVQALLAQIQASVSRPQAALDALLELFEAPAAPSTGITPSEVQLGANAVALEGLFQAGLAIMASELSGRLLSPSRDDANVLRLALTQHLDTLAEQADDAAYPRWVALRAAVASDIGQRSAPLASLEVIQLPEVQPALVLAYRLYADARRADELVQRNRLPDPLQVPGGQPLEVLSA